MQVFKSSFKTPALQNKLTTVLISCGENFANKLNPILGNQRVCNIH